MPASREQLWVALADLWLDTELPEEQLGRIAAVVRDSELDRDELERIFATELAPFLGRNHRSVAGEWAGFDPEWVCEQAARRRGRPALLARLSARLGITTYAARGPWRRVLALAFDDDTR